MLETIRASSQSWIAKLILAMITVPFALWGVDSYLKQAGSNVAVAKVNGESITVQQFSKAMENTRDSMQGKAQADFMENPEVRSAVLDKLINSRIIATEAKHGRYVVSDEQLTKAIVNLPEFQKDGQFSQQLYDEVLTANAMTPSRFEANMRGDLLTEQVRDSITGLAFVPKALGNQVLRVQNQLREVSVYSLHPDEFLPEAKIEPTAVKAYFDKHPDEFRVPEQVKLEFVVFSANNLIAGMQVGDDEAKKYYDENATKFQGDEERHASHILITIAGSKDAAAKAAAKKKAEDVLAEVKKSPEKFAELAKKYSQDPGSAANGGDLGNVKRGLMVKPFEDALFGMSAGSVSGLVETDFGYHIIKLIEVKGAGQSFDTVRGQIRAELMYQKAQAKFAEQAEMFSNTVYEQSSTLEPAAKAHQLEVQKSNWMSREDIAKFFKGNEKIANAAFSDEVLKNKRNSEAVEVSPNTLAAVRVVERRAPSMKSFDDVKASIEDKLKHIEAAKLATQKGEKLLADFKKGTADTGLSWTTPVKVDRRTPQGLTESVLKTAFTIDDHKLPSYVGALGADGGYVLIRLSAVEDGKQDADTQKKQLAQYKAMVAAEYMAAYVKSLRAKAEIKINQELLNAKSAQ